MPQGLMTVSRSRSRDLAADDGSRDLQFRTNLQLQQLRTGDDPLQSTIRNHRQRVDILAGHEF